MYRFKKLVLIQTLIDQIIGLLGAIGSGGVWKIMMIAIAGRDNI